MAAIVKPVRIDLYDEDGIGPVKGDLHVTVSDNAVDPDVASVAGAGAGRVIRVRLSRAKFNALIADLRRVKGEAPLPGKLDALLGVAEEP